MKTNFLKTILPAFAFMLAIVASFAFAAPTQNGMANIQTYYDDCSLADFEDCNRTTDLEPVCTDVEGIQVYDKDTTVTPNRCDIILYQDPL